MSAMKGCSCDPSAPATTALRAACVPALKPALLLGSGHGYSPGRRQQPLAEALLQPSPRTAAPDTACAQVLGFGVGNPSQAAVGCTQKRTAMHWWKALQLYLPYSLLDPSDNISDSSPQTAPPGGLVLNCLNRGD